jgi:hypothetical protein
LITGEERFIAFYIMRCTGDVRQVLSHLVLQVRSQVAPYLCLHIRGWCIVGDVLATKGDQARCCSSRVGQQAAVIEYEARCARRVQHRAEERAAPGSKGGLWISKKTWLVLQCGGHRVPGMAETQNDERVREYLEPEAGCQAEAGVGACPMTVLGHARCPGSRALVQLLTERGRQCVYVKACGRVPGGAEEEQEIIIKIDEPRRFQSPQRVLRRGGEQFLWRTDIKTTAMDQPGCRGCPAAIRANDEDGHVYSPIDTLCNMIHYFLTIISSQPVSWQYFSETPYAFAPPEAIRGIITNVGIECDLAESL